MSTLKVPVPTPASPVVSPRNSFVITPDDDELFSTCCLKLYVGQTGDVTAIMANAPVTQTDETWDPANSDTTNGTLSNGNLTYSSASGTWPLARAQDAMASSTGDKFYAEFTLTNPVVTVTTPQVAIGLCTSGWTTAHQLGNASIAGQHSLGLYVNLTDIVITYDNAASDYSAAGVLVSGDVIGIAIDLTAQTVAWYQNGTLLHTSNLTTLGLNGLNWYFAVTVEDQGTAPSVTANYAAPVDLPAGFKTLSHLAATATLFKAMAVGMYDLALAAVKKTGTTATELVGLY